jgi:hypothetical protein
MAESVDEIRGLPLLSDCRAPFCIGGLICYLATKRVVGGVRALHVAA